MRVQEENPVTQQFLTNKWRQSNLNFFFLKQAQKKIYLSKHIIYLINESRMVRIKIYVGRWDSAYQKYLSAKLAGVLAVLFARCWATLFSICAGSSSCICVLVWLVFTQLRVPHKYQIAVLFFSFMDLLITKSMT